MKRFLGIVIALVAMVALVAASMAGYPWPK
jgi:predicted small secreted protein